MKTIPVRSIKPTEPTTGVSNHFKIRTLSEILAGHDMSQGLHRHDFYFVLTLRKAKGSHEIDFAPSPVRNHSIHLMRPGQVHRLALKAGSEGYLMEFDRTFAQTSVGKDLLRKATNGNFCQLEKKAADKLFTTLETIYNEYQNRREGYLEVLKSSLTIFFVELIRQRKKDENKDDNRNSYAQERLDELMELLEANIRTHKQVSYYADKLNLSPFQLNSVTKTLLSKTVAELIDDHILLESKRHLLATSSQVNQIAYDLGYEDPSYFIRFFKKHTGYTPEAFRQNFR